MTKVRIYETNKVASLSLNMPCKKYLLSIFFALVFVHSGFAQEHTVSSPNNLIKAVISLEDGVSFSLSYKGNTVITNAYISMELADRLILGENPTLKKKNTAKGQISRKPVVPTKDAQLQNVYNELELVFKKNFSLQFRVFNEGVAYRFITADKPQNETLVVNEVLDIDFPANTWSYFPKEQSLYSHYEQHFEYQPLDSVPEGDFCALPVRYDVPGGVGLVITEADLFDYPGLFLERNGNGFKSKFPKYILKTEPLPSQPDRSEIIVEEGNYIAKTVGGRNYPWRLFLISDDDRTFVENDLVFQLSREQVSMDFSWVKPGRIAWDWYNANNVYGVDFESGINNTTYKYYIDFAAAYGLEYVILDEGWTKTTTNVLESNPEIDVPELVAYGKERGVGIILWLLWHPLDQNLEEILKLYSDWDVKGIKVDFMQRADQYMVSSYERIAREAAKNKLLVDFHGAFKPAGLRSAYPNVMTYEGVMGNENNKWSDQITPEHNVTLPFTRMVAGPMDYTPGAMVNAQERNFNISFYRPMSQGTRCHQAAMYVVYESPLQMLCDAPSAYLEDKEATSFISRIPASWDETRVLEGKIADYIVVARRKGDTWYIGAMTDWSARSFSIDLSFLREGTYKMEVLKDGINASKYAEDYKKETISVTNQGTVQADLAPGGGWVAIVKPQE